VAISLLDAKGHAALGDMVAIVHAQFPTTASIA
jgi:hypothetical protein